MKHWADRPREIRNLFNPAFCGVVLLRGIEGFHTVADKGMPFSLTNLVLPLCLHAESRDAINQGARSYLSKIVETHPALLIGLPERARSLIPYTHEAFAYLLHQGAVQVDEQGAVVAVPKSITSTIKGSDETRACQRAARTLGKKMARVGDRATIYMTFRVRP